MIPTTIEPIWVRDALAIWQGRPHFEFTAQFRCEGPSSLDPESVHFHAHVDFRGDRHASIDLHVPLWHLAQRDAHPEPGRIYDIAFCHVSPNPTLSIMLGPMWIDRIGSAGAFAAANEIRVTTHEGETHQW